ncbi:unnamed protein product [Triticum turgidum subsp. durum]|uniref:Uncharacterized protein n=1 Tax=Triticum turgidum subsp. durum TaxID=4567 RepID=A0A9R1ARY1_TRITD|nr:unnamed protein product [Triticum turgidum subsp. durum]
MTEMSGAKAASLALRIVALALSVGAAVVMGSVVSYSSALVNCLFPLKIMFTVHLKNVDHVSKKVFHVHLKTEK